MAEARHVEPPSCTCSSAKSPAAQTTRLDVGFMDSLSFSSARQLFHSCLKCFGRVVPSVCAHVFERALECSLLLSVGAHVRRGGHAGFLSEPGASYSSSAPHGAGTWKRDHARSWCAGGPHTSCSAHVARGVVRSKSSVKAAFAARGSARCSGIPQALGATSTHLCTAVP